MILKKRPKYTHVVVGWNNILFKQGFQPNDLQPNKGTQSLPSPYLPKVCSCGIIINKKKKYNYFDNKQFNTFRKSIL